MIKVGAATETEMKEKKARVEDAMHATKAAVEEGIVPGGGVALLRGASCPRHDLEVDDADERIGVNIIKRCARRADAVDCAERRSGRLDCRAASARINRYHEGFNAQTETYENLVKAGVIDPTKVVRTALQNAGSIASLLLTTEALIAEIPEEKPDAAAGPPGGMGGMY